MARIKKPSPLIGEGVNRQVDGRGKLEQKGEGDGPIYRLYRLQA